jgi:ATP-dependent Clp protease ATP-binding subunit ClpC
MSERFTERACKVVVLAQEEARHFNHNYIGTEHLLLGLLQEDKGGAACVLNSLNIALEEVREQVESIVGYGRERTVSRPPFTPRSKKVLDLALREAWQLGYSYIDTENILLGFVMEPEGVAARVIEARCRSGQGPAGGGADARWGLGNRARYLGNRARY